MKARLQERAEDLQRLRSFSEQRERELKREKAEVLTNLREQVDKLQQQLDTAKSPLNLPDARNDAHRVQNICRGFFGIVALRNREHDAIALECSLDRAKR